MWRNCSIVGVLRCVRGTALLTAVAGCLTAGALSASGATVGLWGFDEGSGTVVHDLSGNGHDANFISVNGGLWQADSPFEPSASNGSFHFGPSRLDVTNAAALNPSGDFTIEGWVKLDTLSGDPYLFSKRNTDATPSGYWVQFGGGNTFTFQVGDGSDYDAYTQAKLGAGPYLNLQPAINTWYHVAAVHTSATNTLYINGISNGGSNGTGVNASSNTAPLTFGYYATSDHYMSGSLDEIRLSDVALSANQLGWNGSLVPEPVGLTLLAPMAFLLIRKRRRPA